MLKKLDEQKAQAIMGEYVLVFFVIVGMVTAMTVFFKRAIQARYYDARQAMGTIITERTKGQGVNGNIYTSYEPYYVKTAAHVYRDDRSTQTLEGRGSSDIFTKETDQFMQIDVKSNTAAPKDVN